MLRCSNMIDVITFIISGCDVAADCCVCYMLSLWSAFKGNDQTLLVHSFSAIDEMCIAGPIARYLFTLVSSQMTIGLYYGPASTS